MFECSRLVFPLKPEERLHAHLDGLPRIPGIGTAIQIQGAKGLHGGPIHEADVQAGLLNPSPPAGLDPQKSTAGHVSFPLVGAPWFGFPMRPLQEPVLQIRIQATNPNHQGLPAMMEHQKHKNEKVSSGLSHPCTYSPNSIREGSVLFKIATAPKPGFLDGGPFPRTTALMGKRGI